MLYWLVIPQIALIAHCEKRIKIWKKWILNPWKQSWWQGRIRNKREKYEQKGSRKEKVQKFSLLFCAKGYLRKSDKYNRYMCLVFILQPMCLLRCCILNRIKSWILIVDSSLIVKFLVHGYTLMHACYFIDGFFFLLQHMTWYAICMLSSWTLMNLIPMLDEIIVKRGRSNVKIFGVEKSMFLVQLGISFF